MLTAHNLREEVFASLASGADAYCLKSDKPALLLLGIRSAAAGSAYLDPQVAHHVLAGHVLDAALGRQALAALVEQQRGDGAASVPGHLRHL